MEQEQFQILSNVLFYILQGFGIIVALLLVVGYTGLLIKYAKNLTK